MLTKEQIQELIPHRYPFLWIDEVTSVDSEKIVAKKFVDPELDVFKGHYPNFPVLPGVIQCEMAMQAGAILIAQSQAVSEGMVPVATRMNNVKFRNMIRPGDTAEIEVVVKERVSNAYFLTGKVSVSGKVTTRLEFACAEAPAT